MDGISKSPQLCLRDLAETQNDLTELLQNS